MSLRHAVLGLLARSPSTGYELTRRFDLSLRTAWHAQHSQIYPALAKLEEAGMVEVVARGARNSKTYDITDAGREELERWLVLEEPDRSQRNESALRLFLGQLLAPDERRTVFDRDLAYVEQQDRELRALRDALEPDEPFAAQVDLGLRTNRVLIDWLREQAERT
ncbi:PadR family transcriptional regulator [Nocardioides deserti]|uniref:PadR family transcriptional regulator n=1 Tax=Nocardioides deserti TaxID=1588644 RepID=A0ABR6UDP8_9ACTN|nr:PadR family transcriptional regulator [Nocardioides deserti]MBC2961916.1 PadR family transcriptional regulator [Nocardioides deserti]GGO79674.1 PadR family transcriptional regulator [Nocardioides deserti]